MFNLGKNVPTPLCKETTHTLNASSNGTKTALVTTLVENFARLRVKMSLGINKSFLEALNLIAAANSLAVSALS